jgi:transketolase
MSQTTTGKTRLKTSPMIASIADEGQATILPVWHRTIKIGR